MEVTTDSSPSEPLWPPSCVEELTLGLSRLLSDLMERSLGVNTFQLTKKLVDRVVSVRYCILTPASQCFAMANQWLLYIKMKVLQK